MNTHLLCFNIYSLCFPQYITSHPSLCLHRLQPWAQRTTLKAVRYGLKSRKQEKFSFQRQKFHVNFILVA
jgi:hypothetical protein